MIIKLLLFWSCYALIASLKSLFLSWKQVKITVHFRRNFSLVFPGGQWVIRGQSGARGEWSARRSRDWLRTPSGAAREPVVCVCFRDHLSVWSLTPVLSRHTGPAVNTRLPAPQGRLRAGPGALFDPWHLQCSSRSERCLSFTYFTQTARTNTRLVFGNLKCDKRFIVKNWKKTAQYYIL